MNGGQPKNQRDGRQLFGTLLDSKPAKARTPGALALSIGLHLALVVLLVLVSRPFIPNLAQKLFQPITIIIPEEESTIATLTRPVAPPPEPPTKQNRREDERGPAPDLTYRPGPVVPLPPPTPGPVTVEPSDGGPGKSAPQSLSQRLIPPSLLDPRLSARGSFAPTDNSPAAAVRERIAATIGEWNDSVAAEADAKRRALDWTKKTKDGKAWGIGPDGRIHLGDITLPAIAFAPPAGRRDEIRARNRDYAEIEAMANREVGRQEFKDRVKAIRARKDKEREEKRKESGSAPITH